MQTSKSGECMSLKKEIIDLEFLCEDNMRMYIIYFEDGSRELIRKKGLTKKALKKICTYIEDKFMI